MKKLIFTLFAVFLLSLTVTAAAFAAEIPTSEPLPGAARSGGNVTITVVLPGKPEAPEPEPVPEPEETYKIVLYPVDVTETNINGGWQIAKTYELTALDNPANIPRGDFERKGASGANWLFTLTDIIKRETANAESKPHTETVTLNTDTKELEQILAQLAPTMEYKSEDEFAGILYLDVASIKVESAGTKTTSYTKTVTREYPRLSNTDTSNVPKTVDENGKTYTLAGVEWKSGNYETVDYERVPEFYTAVASYTATGYSTKVTGYITTAEYKGTLAKLAQGRTVYTAYFEGEEIRTPLEFTEPTAAQSVTGEPAANANVSGLTATDANLTENPAETLAAVPTAEPTEAIKPSEAPTPTETPEPTEISDAKPAGESDDANTAGSNTVLQIIIVILLLMLAGASYIIIRRNPHHEKIDNPVTDADADDSGGDSGAGSRL